MEDQRLRVGARSHMRLCKGDLINGDRSSMNEQDDAASVVAQRHGNDEFGAALVEVEPGVVVMFGSEDIPGLELEPFDFLDAGQRSQVTDSVGQVLGALTGVGNLAAQGAQGLAGARGLVRLAPETLNALEQGRTIVKDGYNLGVVLNKNGKFAAQIRWVPAAGASTAAVAASLGPALALMAVQAQLGRLEALAKKNLELTTAVLTSVKNDQWASLQGRHATLLEELAHARALGAVTDSIWTTVNALGSDTEKDVRLFRAEVAQHLQKLRGANSNKARRAFVEDGDRALADVHSLVTAMTNRAIWLALRGTHQMQIADNSDREQALLERLMSDSRETLAAQNEELREFLHVLQREFVTAGWQASASKRFGKTRAVQELAPLAQSMGDIVASLAHRSAARRTVEFPALHVPSVYDLTPLRQVLTWSLAPDEEVEAMALVSRREDLLGKRQLVVTNRRVLLLDDARLREGEPARTAFTLENVRFVRVHDVEGKAVRLDVVTPEWDHQLTFDGTAKLGEPRSTALLIGTLLRCAMHIPEAEIPKRPGSLAGTSEAAATPPTLSVEQEY